MANGSDLLRDVSGGGGQTTSFERGERSQGDRDVSRATLRISPIPLDILRQSIFAPGRGSQAAPGFVGVIDEELDFFDPIQEPTPTPTPSPSLPQPARPALDERGGSGQDTSPGLDDPGFGIQGPLSDTEEAGLMGLGTLSPGLGLATSFTSIADRLGLVGVVEDAKQNLTMRDAIDLASDIGQSGGDTGQGAGSAPGDAPASGGAPSAGPGVGSGRSGAPGPGDTPDTGPGSAQGPGPAGGASAGPGGTSGDASSDAGGGPGEAGTGGTGGGTGEAGSSGSGAGGTAGDASAEAGGAPGGGGSGDGKGIVCTELLRHGMIPMRERLWWYLGTKSLCSPALEPGYHFWGIHVVKAMRRGRWLRLWGFLARHRARELGYRIGKRENPDYVGKAVRILFEPVSVVIGTILAWFNIKPDYDSLYDDNHPRI